MQLGCVGAGSAEPWDKGRLLREFAEQELY